MIDKIILTILIIIIYIFLILNNNNIIYINSNNGIYTVIKDNESQNKVILLKEIINNMYKLKNYLVNNIDKFSEYKDYIDLLNKNFNQNRTSIYETNSNDTNVTSFSVNKGEELSICLKSRKTGDLHNINLLMYVVIHEMAHFACPEIGHGPLFQKIFKKFLEEAINIGIYKYDNYSKYPQEYCGLNLNSSIIGNL
jgi:predicted metal-dependent hydrolase